MTIQRQYRLPNCTLILEGLSDGTATGVGGQLDTRPLMTMLVNAECRFVGQEQYLSGGRDFFESLVTSVSRYAQEFLSQVPHPKPHGDKPDLVQLHKLRDKNLHLLIVLPVAEAIPAGFGLEMASNSTSYAANRQGVTVQMDLTTVQLFDLVEAIDQFLADRRTLPDLTVSLEPVSRRYRKADQPIAKRAAPAALGVSTLALSAIAFFLVPVPQVRKPAAIEPSPSETTANNANNTSQPTGTPTPTSTPISDTELEKVLTQSPEINDPTHLGFLQRFLYNKINYSWKNQDSVNEKLEYRLAVGNDGAIVGYKEVGRTPIDARQQTPLPELLYLPTTGSVAATEPVAQFRIVFRPKGVLEVSPWRGYTGKPTLGPEITDATVLKGLNDKLYEQIRQSWSTTPTFSRDLEYRVAVNEEGVIADYQARNQPAFDYVKQTPLNSLLKPEAAGLSKENKGVFPQKPLAQFQVVFKADGSLEVSPLQGQ